MGAIYRADAIRLLEDGRPHNLKVWKLSTGDILAYKKAVCIGVFKVKGLHRVKISASYEIRAFRDITLFEIDNKTIYF